MTRKNVKEVRHVSEKSSDGSSSKRSIELGNYYGDRSEFAEASIMDIFSEKSTVCQSPLRGMANLAFLCGTLYCLATPVTRYFRNETVVDYDFLHGLFNNFSTVLSLWGMFIVCSFWAYYSHIFYIQRKITRQTLRIYQLLSEAFCVLFPIYVIFRTPLTIIPTGFTVLCSCVYTMKMHSFTEHNLFLHDHKKTLPEGEMYPRNLTLNNYLTYLLAPTLVYETSFERTEKINWSYVALKLFQVAVTLTQLFTLLSNSVIPVVNNTMNDNVINIIVKLLFPFLYIDWLVFFIVFECICNICAEVSRMKNRLFYFDFWNCTSFDEFARKWNRPVHEFLFRHVYLKFHLDLGKSKFLASVVTFFISGVLHEIVMICCFRAFTPYLFIFLHLQIPFIFVLGKYVKGKNVSNYGWWFCMIAGMPIISALYTRTWIQQFNLPVAVTN